MALGLTEAFLTTVVGSLGALATSLLVAPLWTARKLGLRPRISQEPSTRVDSPEHGSETGPTVIFVAVFFLFGTCLELASEALFEQTSSARYCRAILESGSVPPVKLNHLGLDLARAFKPFAWPLPQPMRRTESRWIESFAALYPDDATRLGIFLDNKHPLQGPPEREGHKPVEESLQRFYYFAKNLLFSLEGNSELAWLRRMAIFSKAISLAFGLALACGITRFLALLGAACLKGRSPVGLLENGTRDQSATPHGRRRQRTTKTSISPPQGSVWLQAWARAIGLARTSIWMAALASAIPVILALAAYLGATFYMVPATDKEFHQTVFGTLLSLDITSK